MPQNRLIPANNEPLPLYNFSVPRPNITWEASTPASLDYDDYYFSTDSGLEESQHVFIGPNKLDSRWLGSNKTSPFTIVETGFGSGLNFLTTLKSWLETPDPKQNLYFLSIEQHPLDITELRLAHKAWPALKQLSSLLLSQYPYLLRGKHHIRLFNGRVELALIFGDVNKDLKNYAFTADCWFLDGFSPAKNPQMWQAELFRLMAQRSKKGTTFSTFTAASQVRKHLINKGFIVNKLSGYGKKREFLSGIIGANKTCDNETLADNYYSLDEARWTQPKPTKLAQEAQAGIIKSEGGCNYYDAIIVGAGLAGLTTAQKLAEKGMHCLIIDKRSQTTGGASGQSRLALYAKFPSRPNKEAKLTLQCLSYSQSYFKALQSNSSISFWNASGLLQTAWNKRELERQQEFSKNYSLPNKLVYPVDQHQAYKLSAINTEHGGLWFPQSGTLDPSNFAKFILGNTAIDQLLNAEVRNFDFDTQKQAWQLELANQQLSSRYLILANTHAIKEFPYCQHLPLKPIRGQVSSVYLPTLAGARSVVCGEGYLCPNDGGWHHFGATYELDNLSEQVTQNSHHMNITSLIKWLPSLASSDTLYRATHKASAGLRCTTPDYNPIAGRAPDFEFMLDAFAKLRKDSNACEEVYGSFHNQLFINVGHGSKGLMTAPLCADLIASEISRSPLPIDSQLREMLNPARFLIKHLTQRRI